MKRIEEYKDIPIAVNDIKGILTNLTSDNRSNRKLGFSLSKKLLIWLNTWLDQYLPSEKTFQYNKLMPYSRGMVVFADFGFKVGSEQGGKRYALIVENNNAITNKTVTVIPLGSIDKTESVDSVDAKHEVFLGYGIFKDEINKTTQQLKKETDIQKRNALKRRLSNYEKGSVALVNQMCALSKIRIYSPKYDGDELSSFKLESKKLDAIDRAIKSLYMKKTLGSKVAERIRELVATK